METELRDGLWPVMLTPFTEENEVDYAALDVLTDWYIQGGSDGLFAVCQSSEMALLSLEERLSVARAVVKKAAGRVQVIASGHVAESPHAQIEELKRMHDTGVYACVLITGRLVAENECDDVLKKRIEHILESTPEIRYGLYECPAPYKRLLTPELIRWLADTGRFVFLKDTCCDAQQLHAKLDAARGSGFKLFNAHTSSLLDSLRHGASGFSGIMANYHPQLYAKLLRYHAQGDPRADALNAYIVLLGICNLNYPLSAKYYLGLDGVPMTTRTRAAGNRVLTDNDKFETEQLYRVSKELERVLDI